MADQFDIVDIVYNAVEPASTGFILYKDQSGDGEKNRAEFNDVLSNHHQREKFGQIPAERVHLSRDIFDIRFLIENDSH